MLARGVRRLDALLRRRLHIVEFTDDARCLFRIALVTAQEEKVLADGTRVHPGEPLIELHLWNEHIPPVSADGPTFAWAGRAGRLIGHSLRLLAAHVEAEPALREAKALHGRMALPARGGGGEFFALARRFGFHVNPVGDGSWRARLDEFWSNLHLWALIWSFNPGGLRRKGFSWCWCELWISRAALLARYGVQGASPGRAPERQHGASGRP